MPCGWRKRISYRLAHAKSGGSYTYNDPVYGEIYVGPYTVSVNNGTTTTDLPLVCDDYQTEIYINQNWNATAYTISSAATLSSTVSLLKFGSQGTFGGGVTNATQAYEEIFYLTEQMEQRLPTRAQSRLSITQSGISPIQRAPPMAPMA